jgi:ribosome maturation factor RimP
MTAQAASRARLLQVLEPAVTATGFDLEDVTVSPAGKRRVVRVVVDRDGGVDLDDVADVARAVSDLLDEDPDLVAGAYVLEVTSPGVDRPLTDPRHWRRAVGRLVKATLPEETVVGRVTASTDTDVTLEVDGVERTLLQAEVVQAVVQVEFSRQEAEQ